MKEVTINPLDPSQQYIVDKLTEEQAEKLTLVYGPPGSGKSHMLLSLIFELALQGKKVLFCSQNPEALSVIVRKYKDLDREFGIKETNLSFLDLCLDLNSVEQAKKTYIRNLKARLRKPILEVSPIKVEDEAPEVLSYTYLDKIKNESVEGKMASDEIVRYSLEFQGDYPPVPMMVTKVSELNVRKIISLIVEASENFIEYPDEYKLFNSPDNALRFLNAENLNLNLGQILEKAVQLDNDMIELDGISKIRVNKNSTIQDVLDGILLLTRVNNLIDVEKVIRGEKKLAEIKEELGRIKEKKGQFVSVSRLFYRVPKDEWEKYETIDNRILEKTNLIELRKYVYNLSKLKEYHLKTIEKYSLDKEVDILWLISVVASRVLDIESGKRLTELCPGLLVYGYEKIETLLNDIEKWNKLGSIKKMFEPIPASFETSNRDIVKEIAQNESYFDSLYAILKGTRWTVKELLDIKERKVSEILVPYQIKDAHEGTELLNRLLLTYDISNNIDIDNKSMGGILNEIESLIEQSCLITKINFALGSLEKKKINDLKEIVQKNIINQKLEEEIEALENEVKKFLRDDINIYADIEKCLNILEDTELCDEHLTKLSNLKNLGYINTKQLEELKNELEDLRKKNIFSEEYYKIKAGATVAQWQSYNGLITKYNDINQFNRWIKYNIFRSGLYDEFGGPNRRGLDGVFLAGFEDFAQLSRYIVNNLLRHVVFGLDLGENIKKSYLRNYKNDLKTARKNKCCNGLRGIKKDAMAAADDLIVKWSTDLNGNRIKEVCKNFTSILNAYPVIIATPGDVSKMVPAKKDMFDYVVIDEGSQMLPGAALPLFYRAKHAVVIGDPEQMPPTNSAMLIGTDSMGLPQLEPSIIDKMIEVSPTEYHLKVHYRSKYNCLFEPSRKIIYAKDGIDPVWEARGSVMPISLDDGFGDDSTAGFAKVVRLIDKYTAENNKTNFCVVFARSGKDGPEGFEDYLEANDLKRILERINNEKEDEIRLVTVLNCQGITYEHTIHFLPYYTAMKSMYYFNLQAGSYRRANVAITRQTKTHDIVMGNTKSEWLATCNDLIQNSPHSDIKKSARLLSELFTMANRNMDIDYLRETLGRNALNIDSPLAQQLYNKLLAYFGERIGNELEIFCEVGYKIRIPDEDAQARNDQNVGFRIDLGIYSIKHQKFVLGIEMDGATYHSGYIKEFSDMQRQEILEDKGWELYRIWSTNWRNDLNGEFRALVDVIEEKLAEPTLKEVEVSPEIAARLIKGFSLYKKKREQKQLRDPSIIEFEEDSRENEPREFIDDDFERDDQKDEMTRWIERVRPEDKLELANYNETLKIDALHSKVRGETIELSIDNKRTAGNITPYQELLVTNVTDNYLEVRYPDSSAMSYFRVRYDEVKSYRIKKR